MRISNIVTALLLATTLFVSAPVPLYATSTSQAGNDVLDIVHKAAGNSGGNLNTQGSLFPKGDLPTIAYRIITVFFSLLGLIFLGMMLYGGYNWLTAMGEEEKVETAKKTITSAVMGILIIIASYAITAFVINKVYQSSTGGGAAGGAKTGADGAGPDDTGLSFGAG